MGNEVTVILVSPFGKGFRAVFNERTDLWGYGETPDEAVGDLIRCNPAALNIMFIYP